MNLRRLAPLLALLLISQQSGAQPVPRIDLASVRILGAEAAVDLEPWVQGLLERWRAGYAAWVTLADARAGKPGGAAAELEVAVAADGCRTRVTLVLSGGRRLEARASIAGRGAAALLSSLAGDLFYLWAQAGLFTLTPSRPGPRLAALLSLDSLKLLPGWRPDQSEPLDCAATPDGPVLLFSDRILSLDRELNVAPATGRDLLLLPRPPPDFRPDRIFLNQLGEPLLYSADTGEVLRYSPAGLERQAAGVVQPLHAARLPSGGLALLSRGTMSIVRLLGGSMTAEPVRLPEGFFTAVEADGEGNLWLLDLKERRVRVLDPSGEEVFSVKPALDPARLPFPQVFRLLPDGGLLLGGSGELWRFDAFGAPVWRLAVVFTGVREGLPAFLRVAAAEDLSLYLLDPIGRRLMRLSEADAPLAGPEAELADLFRRLEAGSASAGQLVQFCLDRGLYLTAYPFFRASLPGASSTEEERFIRRVKAQVARSLSELAGQHEARLLLPEAEEALGEALRLLRELRAEDPVEASYAQAVRDVTVQRARLREELLRAPEGGLEASIETAGGELVVKIRNPSSFPAVEASLQAHWAGLPDGRVTELMEPIRPGYTVRLPLPLPEAPLLVHLGEDLPLRLSILIRYRQAERQEAQYLSASLVLRPDGRIAPWPKPR